MPKTDKPKSVRFQPSLRAPLAEEVQRLAEQEGRTDPEMAAVLIDEAVRERGLKGLAKQV